MKKLMAFLLLLTAFTAFSQTMPVKSPVPDEKTKTVSGRELIQKPATVNPCAGGNVSIPSTISGSNYQWQVNSGGSFTNISNGGIYSGATTPTLQITGAPSSLYGYQYRCLVDGNFSAVYVLKFVSTWTGAVDNTWENGSNWNCGSVPDANTDVIINSGTPVLNANASVRSLTLGTGITLTVKPGLSLTVAY